MATRRNSPSFTCCLWTTVMLVAVLNIVVDSAKLGKEEKHAKKNEKVAKVVEDDWAFFTDPDMLNTFDDEDYPNDEQEGSGEYEGSGSEIIPEPGQTLYFRSEIAFTNIEYKESFANGFDDPEFQRTASLIETEVENLFNSIPGKQTATVVELKPGSTLAILDIGTTGNPDLQLVEDTVTTAILTGHIGTLTVDPTKFDIKLVGVGPTEAPAVKCKESEFRCTNGQCIDRSRECDGYSDCTDRSDESNCARPTPPVFICRNDEFKCDNGQCVESYKRCDRRQDCFDGTDEDGCIISCNLGEFSCEDQQQCIDGNQQCDNFADCADGSDEKDCPVTCEFEQFTCLDQRQCISIYSYCDGIEHCDDKSDEVNCPKKCSVGEFLCKSGQCIDERRHCDNYPDCADRSDEENCPQLPVTESPETTSKPCDSDESTCTNGQCIKKEYVCDGDKDCTDGSDEMRCGVSDCEPNEFICEDGGCVQKIWRCDGEEDCIDGSDELSCDPKSPGETCETWEYECLEGGQCVPASYQCDGELDCNDRSDEIGCSEPTILSGPEELVTVSRGQTVILRCEAEGSPMPIISWRLNWGHVSSDSRVTSTTVNGIGILQIDNAQEQDSGAYTCEAMNSKGYKFAVPDAIVVVTPPEGVCQDTVFNEAALVAEECVVCFCFGIVKYCVSSSYYKTQETLYFNEADNTKGVDLIRYNRGSVRPIDSEYLQVQTVTGELAVQDFTTQLGQGDFYWMLPAKFLGNQLTSYGGTLQYMIMFDTTEIPRSPSIPDIIVRGNGITLQYRISERATVGVQNKRSLEMTEFGWEKVVEGRGDVPEPASRADLMMVLENIDLFLIRASYHSFMTYSSLSDISLDIAIPQSTGQGKATLVEDCECPTGYGGLSCEECAKGYTRIRNNEYLGVCIPCDCNGHSEDCDAETGQCQGCRDNTAGERCDQCAPGYYGDAVYGLCKKCECPLSVPSNNFSPTCHLDFRDNIICDACPRGYAGDKCDRCAPGFTGNPSIPGGKCVDDFDDLKDRCSEDGSLNPGANGVKCECKDGICKLKKKRRRNKNRN